MSVVSNSVLLLKAQKSEQNDDKYQSALNKAGFTIMQVKTIDFNFINLEVLRDKLNEPGNYQGIIFSSPRCVTAVKKALNNKELNPDWINKSNYVVGEATYDVALHRLGLKCKGKEAGNGENLSAVIARNHGAGSKPFLMPCSSFKTDTIQTYLEEHRLTIDPVTVYEPVFNPDVDKEMESLTHHFSKIPEFMVFFSPSGVQALTNCINKFLKEVDLLKFVSIGPTTNKALEELGLTVYATAEKPNPESLLKAIQR